MICTYCGLPDADLLVGVLETNSGPGIAQRAHSSCADARGVKTLEERVPADQDRATSGRPE